MISTLGKELFYRVDQICTVLPDQTEELSVIPGRDYATLVTCTPYGVNTHRLLIRGKRTEMVTPQEKDTVSSVEHKKDRNLSRLIVSLAVVFVILAVTVFVIRIRKKKFRQGEKG